MRVLVVDDDLGTCETLKVGLVKLGGHTVVCALDSESGVAAMRSARFDAGLDHLLRVLAGDSVPSSGDALSEPRDQLIGPTAAPPRQRSLDRWADLVVRGVHAAEDPRTLDIWRKAAGVCRSTLEMRHAAANVRAHDAKDLTRLLWAARVSRESGSSLAGGARSRPAHRPAPREPSRSMPGSHDGGHPGRATGDYGPANAEVAETGPDAARAERLIPPSPTLGRRQNPSDTTSRTTSPDTSATATGPAGRSLRARRQPRAGCSWPG